MWTLYTVFLLLNQLSTYCQSSVCFIIECLKSRKQVTLGTVGCHSTFPGLPQSHSRQLSSEKKLIPISSYVFPKCQCVVISLNTPTQVYFIRMVILKLISSIKPEISVSFLMSVQIIKVNNKNNIMKYDKNN